VFQVDLFPARGPLPITMDQVGAREKDIRYSSRTRLNTDLELERRNVARYARRLLEKLPAEWRDNDDVQALAQWAAPCAGGDIVHLIYRSKDYEHFSKDYEFSRWTMQDHWSSGRTDMQQTLNDPRWINRGEVNGDMRVFDLAGLHTQKDLTQ
jgi:NTE family protein